jgi:hypothetical protein
MNRRQLITFGGFGMAGVFAAGAAGARPRTWSAAPSGSFLRMRGGELGCASAKVFLDGVDITNDCLAVDTQRGEVEVFVRVKQPNGLAGVSHVAHRIGAVRVELDGFVYTSPAANG